MHDRLQAALALVALGPVTGLLVLGFLHHRHERPILAALYLAAIPSAWWLLALAAARLLHR